MAADTTTHQNPRVPGHTVQDPRGPGRTVGEILGPAPINDSASIDNPGADTISTAARDRLRAYQRQPTAGTRPPTLDVVIPVYNEERDLAASVRRLHAFLEQAVPYSFRITVADNASTDRTPQIAAELARELSGVTVRRLAQKGRGRALRSVWTMSDAPVLVYGGRLLAWTPGGYLDRNTQAPAGEVTVITPRATVAVLAAGYHPVIHPSATAG